MGEQTYIFGIPGAIVYTEQDQNAIKSFFMLSGPRCDLMRVVGLQMHCVLLYNCVRTAVECVVHASIPIDGQRLSLCVSSIL